MNTLAWRSRLEILRNEITFESMPAAFTELHKVLDEVLKALSADRVTASEANAVCAAVGRVQKRMRELMQDGPKKVAAKAL